MVDKDGENPATSQVENILTSNPALVKVLEDQGRHGLETGDRVTFSRVVGLDGAGHCPLDEVPDEVNGLILDFFDRLGR